MTNSNNHAGCESCNTAEGTTYEVGSATNTPHKAPENIIATFDIPEVLANELAGLIPRVAILKDLLLSAVESPARFDKLQEQLIPLQDRYTTLKNMITYEHVPVKYRNPNYSWSYPGKDISGNTCWIEAS